VAVAAVDADVAETVVAVAAATTVVDAVMTRKVARS
jgi:hypothetical protein